MEDHAFVSGFVSGNPGLGESFSPDIFTDDNYIGSLGSAVPISWMLATVVGGLSVVVVVRTVVVVGLAVIVVVRTVVVPLGVVGGTVGISVGASVTGSGDVGGTENKVKNTLKKEQRNACLPEFNRTLDFFI